MSAKTKVQTTVQHRKKSKPRRPGVHSKTKQSLNKASKIYKKPRVGQG